MREIIIFRFFLNFLNIYVYFLNFHYWIYYTGDIDSNVILSNIFLMAYLISIFESLPQKIHNILHPNQEQSNILTKKHNSIDKFCKSIIDNSIQDVIYKNNFDIVISNIEHTKKQKDLIKELICNNGMKKLFKNKRNIILEFENVFIEENFIECAESIIFFKQLVTFCEKKYINVGLISIIKPHLILDFMKKIFGEKQNYFNLNNVITSHHFKKKSWSKNKFQKISSTLIEKNYNIEIPNKIFLVNHILQYYNIAKKDTIYIGSELNSLVALTQDDITSVCLLDNYLCQNNFIEMIYELYPTPL